MNTKLSVLVISLLMLLPLSGHGAAPTRVLEDGREVRSSMLTMPTLATGNVAIKGCSTCKRREYRLAPTARFYIDKTEVRYQDLQRHLLNYPGIGVLVVSPKGQPVITRITASAAGTR